MLLMIRYVFVKAYGLGYGFFEVFDGKYGLFCAWKFIKFHTSTARVSLKKSLQLLEKLIDIKFKSKYRN